MGNGFASICLDFDFFPQWMVTNLIWAAWNSKFHTYELVLTGSWRDLVLLVLLSVGSIPSKCFTEFM